VVPTLLSLAAACNHVVQTLPAYQRRFDHLVKHVGKLTFALNQFIAQGIYLSTSCCAQVGNGDLASTMQRSHFALWALAKAPLLIGTDLRAISKTSLDILKATEVRGVA
jgi:hypothetical protein